MRTTAALAGLLLAATLGCRADDAPSSAPPEAESTSVPAATWAKPTVSVAAVESGPDDYDSDGRPEPVSDPA